jgi:hypothetical protein
MQWDQSIPALWYNKSSFSRKTMAMRHKSLRTGIHLQREFLVSLVQRKCDVMLSGDSLREGVVTVGKLRGEVCEVRLRLGD